MFAALLGFVTRGFTVADSRVECVRDTSLFHSHHPFGSDSSNCLNDCNRHSGVPGRRSARLGPILQVRSERSTMSVSAETVTPRPVRLEVGDVSLNGDLSVPSGAQGLVIFAHGSGSSRRSSRNRAVAEVLQHGRLATLLLDLLTETEEA